MLRPYYTVRKASLRTEFRADMQVRPYNVIIGWLHTKCKGDSE